MGARARRVVVRLVLVVKRAAREIVQVARNIYLSIDVA